VIKIAKRNLNEDEVKAINIQLPRLKSELTKTERNIRILKSKLKDEIPRAFEEKTKQTKDELQHNENLLTQCCNVITTLKDQFKNGVTIKEKVKPETEPIEEE